MRMVLAVMSQSWVPLWATGNDDGPVWATAVIKMPSNPILNDRVFLSSGLHPQAEFVYIKLLILINCKSILTRN